MSSCSRRPTDETVRSAVLDFFSGKSGPVGYYASEVAEGVLLHTHRKGSPVCVSDKRMRKILSKMADDGEIRADVEIKWSTRARGRIAVTTYMTK